MASDFWPPVEDYWPQRLLHIPTMTSHVRQGRATYCSSVYPKYSILSYTWGRWELSKQEITGGRSLPVQGTTWKIPSVYPDHFTVDTFQRVVALMGSGGCEWAWIDIACIDQEDDNVKMQEVGRQASIFKNASSSFVWLSRLPFTVLQSAYASFVDAGLEFTFTHHKATSEQTAPLLQRLHESAATILSDPWFTSLWTLQEIMMRNDALIVTREGTEAIAVVDDLAPHSLYMATLMNTLGNTLESLRSEMLKVSKVTSKEGTKMMELISVVEKLIYQSGLTEAHSARDPNLQYGMVKFRQTRHAEDRIYGIMQIYNLRVGQAARPNARPAFEELVEEFGVAINAQSAFRGQLFVHTAPTRPALKWCITEDSTVPEEISTRSGLDKNVCTRVEIYKDTSSTGSMMAHGAMCRFQDFYDLHIASMPMVQVDICLDYEFCEEVPMTSGMRCQTSPTFRDPDLWQLYGRQLLLHLGADNVFVVLLGHSPSYSRKHIFRDYYAVILHKTPRISDPSRTIFSRVGICAWQMVRDPGDSIQQNDGDHEEYDELIDHFRYNILVDLKVDLKRLREHSRKVEKLFSGLVTIELG